MNSNFQELALIGPSASGKSALSLEIAQELGFNILSLDSLLIYKELNIASAKPSSDELSLVPHFGVNLLNFDEEFNVLEYENIYLEARERSIKEGRGLLIVGGSSFYLKVLKDGISRELNIGSSAKASARELLKSRDRAYDLIKSVDSELKIEKQDSYRLCKALEIYFEYKKAPSEIFKSREMSGYCKNIEIYEIDISRDLLRERIERRTKKMLQSGLIDEIAFLESKYSRECKPFGSIGVKEVLLYFDKIYSKNELFTKIATHTAQLAKRQQIFNKTQFEFKVSENLDTLRATIISKFRN